MGRASPSRARAARAPRCEPFPVRTVLALHRRKRMRIERADRPKSISRNYEALQISQLLIKTHKAADGLPFAPFNTGRIQPQVQMHFASDLDHSGSTVGSGGTRRRNRATRRRKAVLIVDGIRKLLRQRGAVKR